jgi:hypothetical protein
MTPRYGALIADGGFAALGPVEIIDGMGVDLRLLRLLADGRSSFVGRAVGASDRLLCFERTREYESSATHLATTTGGVVIQRLGRGWVRLCDPTGVATWDGAHWSLKQLSTHVAEAVARELPAADRGVLDGLVELCVHWLAAGRVGATLVWSLEREPRELGHLGLEHAVEIPELNVCSRVQFAPLLNALAQHDRAALIGPRGQVSTLAVHLRTTETTRRQMPSYRGTRHTSGLRYSADEPSALVLVVSSSGTLSVFWQGRRLATT